MTAPTTPRRPPVLTLLGGRQGIVDGALPPILLVAVNALAGLAGMPHPLLWASAAALTAGGLTLLRRRATGGSTAGASRGLVALGLALGLALVTGQAKDFFLPGMLVDAAYGVALAGSVLVGRPLVGYLHVLLLGGRRDWRSTPSMRRLFALATLGWAGVYAVRAGAQLRFYLADQPELLGLAKVLLGWPLTALGVTLTLAALRRVGAHDCPS